MQHLKIGDNALPFKLTFSQILKLSELHKVQYVSRLEKLMTEMEIKNLPTVILYGLQGGAGFEGVDCPFKDKDEILAELDKDPSLITRAFQAVADDLTATFATDDDKEDSDEKKSSAGPKYKQ